VGDSWLHEDVCRQRTDLWVKVDKIKICVNRDLKSG
jgi:hypothetical protein